MNSNLSGLRAIDALTLVLAAVLSLGASWMLFSLNKELTASQELFDDNLPSYSVKAEYELARLVTALNEFMLGTSDKQEIQLRYDIFLARLTHYEAAVTSENLQPTKEVQDKINELLELTLEYDEPLFALQQGDIAQTTVIEDVFQRMYSPLEELNTLNHESHYGLLKSLDDSLARGVRVGSALIVATILFGALTLVLFWNNLKEKTRFSADLERQIQARTEDLQISNASLKTEMIERKRAEITLTEREHQMHRVQKMEAIGRLTSGVAHDFNNLLAVIMGNIELLKGSADKALSEKYVDNALAATLMGSQLTRKLLAFGRRSPLKSEIVNVNQVILEIDDLLIHTLPENISLDTNFDDGIWPISVDRSLLENVMLNLVINARDALHEGGSISVKTSNTQFQNKRVQNNDLDTHPEDFVSVAISDEGTGMNAQVLDQAFEPFFSTKTEAEGSGLGLSMASGFVQQSHGRIEVTSAPGKGTCVQLLFPRCAAELLDTLGKENSLTIQTVGRTRKILVVEDSEAVRQVVVEQLLMLGYETIEASNGNEAFAKITTDSSIDLLLSDVVMPGELQGFELAERARQLRPELRIIIMSGYPKTTERNESESGCKFTKLMKPVSLAELSRALLEEFEKGSNTAPALEMLLDNA